MQLLPFSRTRDRRGLLALAALVAASPLVTLSAPPVLDDPVPLNPQNFPTQVEPRVPIGKALIFPITASDPENGPLKYTVTSDNPKITVTVRTALPKLKVQVDHAGAGTEADPAFSGVMEFALLRDLAPATVENISGFAQGRFYNYNTEPGPNFRNQLFHRIANLDPSEQPEGSFIIQGGDPKGSGSGGPGFAYSNEFHPAAIFASRGQLAMANTGIDAANKGTNGSQFFVTLGQPRFLDYNHTIFGQLLRGWDLAEKIADVPVDSDDNKPLIDVKLTSATVELNVSDAILLVSATAPGSGKITVKVTDQDGESTTKDFTVTAYKDTINDPPFLRPVANQTVASEKLLGIPIQAVDLESDFSFINHDAISDSNVRTSGGGGTAFVLGDPGFVGPFDFGIAITQFEMNYRGSIDGSSRPADDKIAIAIAVGDKKIDATARNLGGAPGVPLSDTLLATYLDGDPAALPSDFTATVIWGDGTYFAQPDSNSNGNARFPCTITRDPSNPFPGAFRVSSGHIYQNEGLYPVTIELTAAKGQRATLRTIAVISSGTVRAFGKGVGVKGRTATDAVVATFTDSALAALTNYSARVHWGDGNYSAGTIKRTPKGELQILGTHTFSNEGEYAVTIELTKTGDPNPPAIAWSRFEVIDAKAAPILPPYATPNLVGQMGGPINIGQPVTVFRSGINTSVAAQLIVVNGGSKASRPGKLRFYLSEDKVTNLTDETDPVNPKDLPVKIGTLKEISLQSLPAGAGVRFVFNKTGQGDFRLKFPPGEGGEGLNLLAHFEYSDPLADNLPILRDTVVGPFNPFIVDPLSLTVREMAGADATKKFSVKLAKKPRANVVIPITLNTSASAEITVTPTTLTFTPDNWLSAQEVTVTAKDDTVANDTKNVLVTVGAATSTDIRFNNQDPSDVVVAVKDKAP